MLTMERNALHNLNIAQIWNLIDNEDRIKVRKLEKLNTKCIKIKYGIIFNDTCINEELFPSYTNKFICIYTNINDNIYL